MKAFVDELADMIGEVKNLMNTSVRYGCNGFYEDSERYVKEATELLDTLIPKLEKVLKQRKVLTALNDVLRERAKAGERSPITHKQLLLLATHGFKWYHDGVTDRVDADCIFSVNGVGNELLVHYKDRPDVVMASTAATVSLIEIPEDPTKTWIFVHYERIHHRYKKEPL